MTKPTSGGGGGGWVAHRHNLLIERRGHIDPLQQQPRHQRCDNAAQRAESGARKRSAVAHLARGPEPVGVAPRGGEPSALLGQVALKEQLAVCEVAVVARRLQRVATQAGVSASGGIHPSQVASPAVGNSLHVMYMNACSPALQSRGWQ